MTTLFYFGEEYGRSEVTPFKGRIDSMDIKRITEIGDDEYAQDDFLHVLSESKGHKYSLVIHLIISEMDKESLNSILAGASGSVLCDEIVFGIGNTKEKAMLAFADVANDDEDW